MMHQPIDQGRGQGVVHVEQGAPFPEGSIRGQHDRSGFVTGRHYLEQQVGPTLVDGQIAQLIELCVATHNSINVENFKMWSIRQKSPDCVQFRHSELHISERPYELQRDSNHLIRLRSERHETAPFFLERMGFALSSA